jgi:hypothetical protein
MILEGSTRVHEFEIVVRKALEFVPTAGAICPACPRSWLPNRQPFEEELIASAVSQESLC